MVVEAEESSSGYGATDGIEVGSGKLRGEIDDGRTPEEENMEENVGCCSCCEKCSLDRHMLPVKLFYFFFFGARGAVTPYLAIYFKQLGLSPDQIGLVAGMRPIVGFGSGPAWGAIADKFKIRRICFILSMFGGLFFMLGLGFIKKPKRIKECPNIVNETIHQKSKRSITTDVDFHLSVETSRPFIAEHVSTENQNGRHKTSGRRLLYHLFEPTYFQKLKPSKNKTNAKGNLHNPHRRRDTYYRKEMKENISWIYEYSSLYMTVVSLILLIFFGELIQAPTSALADAATLHMLGEEKVSIYGHQRAWGAVGFGLSSFLVGLLLSYTRTSVKICGIILVFSNYMILFYVFAGEMSVALLCGFYMDYICKDKDKKDEGEHSTTEVLRLFMSIHYASLLSTSYFMGICNGVIWGFLYWHLENLGATQLLLGVVSIITYACEFIMFFFVDVLIRPFGYIGTLYLALICYGVRFVLYAVIKNPWYVIPAELLQGLTFSSVWTCLTRYSCSAVPKASLATVQGILHGVYWGLGVGTGHLAGGIFIDNFGAKATFGTLGVGSILTLIFFATAQKFSDKPSPLKGSLEHQYAEGTGFASAQ